MSANKNIAPTATTDKGIEEYALCGAQGCCPTVAVNYETGTVVIKDDFGAVNYETPQNLI